MIGLLGIASKFLCASPFFNFLIAEIGEGGHMNKKFWIKLLVFALVVSMVLSFAACNGSKGNETTVKPEVESTEPNTQQTTEPNTQQTTEPKTPDTTEPTTPDTTEPTTPDTTEPTTPDTTEPTTPDTTETTAPVTTEPTTSDTTEPTGPVLPEADSALTIEQVIALGSEMAHNTYSEGKYYVVGVIKSVYNTTYGNMIIVDDAGNELTVYGTWSADGQTRYDKLDTKPVAGDTITVYGVIGQYNGTAQVKNGWIVAHIPAEPTTPDTTEPTTPDTTEPTTPDTTEPTTPDTTEPTTPDTTEPTTPDTTEPTTPDTTEPTTPDTTEPTTPDTTEPTTPDTTEPDTETEICTHSWSEYTEDSDGHFRVCEGCGDYEYASHNVFEEYCGDDTQHWKECCDCKARFEVETHDAVLYQVDYKQHSLVCEICKKVFYTVDHVYNKIEELHECDCGAEKICAAVDTDYRYNDTYHWKLSCDICGIDSEKAEHDWIYVPSKRSCAECGYVQCCNDDHRGYDAEGHWIEEDCEICRITADEEKIAHEGKRVRMIQGADQYTLARTCNNCMYTYYSWTVPNSTNFYSTPVQIMNNWNSGANGGSDYAPSGVIRNDEDRPYARVTLYGGASFEFVHSTCIKGFAADEPISGGSGRLAIIRMRAHNVGFISLALNSNKSEYANENFNPGVSPHRNDRVAANIVHDEWITYVIDLSLLGCGQYPANDTEVTNISFGMFFNGHPTDGTAYVDIEYAAICDTWEEAEAIVGTGRKVFYTSWTTTANDSVRLSNGAYLNACTGECTPTLTVNGNRYVYTCSSCGAQIETRTVKVGEDGINYYSAPCTTQAYNNWNTGENASSTAYSGQLMIYEDSFVYNRISLQAGGSFEFTNGTSTPNKGFKTVDDTIYGAGRYMVIKMRVGSGEEHLRLCAWDGNTADRGGDPIFDAYGSPQTVRNMTQDNKDWVVYVIEISALFANTDYAAGDDTVTRAVFGMKGDGNGGEYKGGAWQDFDETDYVDIAYFAICDDWSEVAKVAAGEQTVLFTGWSDAVGYNEVRNPDGTTVVQK